MIDEHLTRKNQISRNIGIISKLRYYLSIQKLKQINYNLIYPYISYGILAWGSTYMYKSNLTSLQTKQNHIAMLIFLNCTYGRDTESAKPLLNLLGILTVDHVYKLHVSKFVHAWHKGLFPEHFSDTFQYASSLHDYNTRYAAKQNLYKSKVRTNVGKQSISFMGSDIWRDLPSPTEEFKYFFFSKTRETSSSSSSSS